MDNYSPYFPEDSINSYTVNGVKYKTFTTNFETKDDVYDTTSKAEERSYNLGCAGYRKVLVSSTGEYKYGPCSSLADYQNIFSSMKKTNPDKIYYEFDPENNVYDIMNSINDKDIEEGFDYREQIFPRTLSNVIYRDPGKEAILSQFQKTVFALIESVKQIRNHFNYTVPRNNKRVF